MRSAYHPEGRQAKSVTHHTDYEEAGGKRDIQWLRSVPLLASDWAKNGSRGVPGGVLVTFSPWKK